MVGIVPRSAKLMELAGLFSGKVKSLLGIGVGSLAFKGAPAGPCRGNVCQSRFLGLGSLVPRVLAMVFSSPEILSSPRPTGFWNLRKSSKARSPDSDRGGSQKWWLLEVKQTYRLS